MVTVAFGLVAISEFKINSDLTQLIRQEAGWRADFDQFQEEFPELTRTAAVVLSSNSLERLEAATVQVTGYLSSKPDRFSSVFAPGHDEFIRENLFLYMDLDQLDLAVDRLAQAQPWLASVASDPSLVGVFELLIDGLKNDPSERFGEILSVFALSVEQTLKGEDNQIWWGDQIFPLTNTQYQLIYVKAPSNFLESLPDAKFMEELRLMLGSIKFPEGVEARLTGEIPLQHEEIEAAIDGITLSGWVALILLFLVMFVGVRSLKIIIGTFLLLGMGVIWTVAYALLVVGEFNTLSLIFVVMFFGLGVDFALHYSLRYQEAVNVRKDDIPGALVDSAQSVGRAISLGALTTAIGFLGFWPTDYQGLADLGVISAGGMLIACMLALTFLPAFYSLMDAPRSHFLGLPSSDRVTGWLINKRTSVLVASLLLGLLAGMQAAQLQFDYSVLALKDPDSESMSTHKTLQNEGISTDYSLFVVDELSVSKDEIESLATVKEVVVVEDLLPADQEEKLYLLEDLQALFAETLAESPRSEMPSIVEIREASRLLRLALASSISGDLKIQPQIMERLSAGLEKMETAEDKSWFELQRGAVRGLSTQLTNIKKRIEVEEVSFEELPDSMTSRLISDSGKRLSVIIPAQDMDSISNLSDFIENVRAYAPKATGRPVIEWGVGSLVVDSFQTALLISSASILIVLLLTLRHVLASLIVLVPLVLAALLTFGFAVLTGISINMANILVLPLIFGLGAASGIHVVDRYLGGTNVSDLMQSSTPRAVVLSNLTTVGAFASLSLSSHQGAASVGLLLTIAVCLLLVFTLFLLPVLLNGIKKISP